MRAPVVLARFHGPAYALMRIVIGCSFAAHGAQKLFGALGGTSMVGNPLLLTAGIIELGGGILIAVGLFAGVVAFIACGEMAFAYFHMHAPKGLWPIENGGELAVLYCFIFLVIASHGSGIWSLDSLLGSGSSNATTRPASRSA